MLLKEEWFKELNRKHIKQIIDENTDRRLIKVTNLHFVNQEDKQYIYQVSLASAELTVYKYLSQLLVEPTNESIWLVHTLVTKPLSKKEFIDYNAKTVERLSKQPPSHNYSGLVYMTALLNLLTKLEIGE